MIQNLILFLVLIDSQENERGTLVTKLSFDAASRQASWPSGSFTIPGSGNSGTTDPGQMQESVSS